MKNEKWDDVHGNTTPDDRMVAFLESPTDSYAILQLREDVDDNIPLMFANYSYLQKKEMEPEIDRYEVVYHGSISMSEDVNRQLEDLYVKFNIDHPDDFRGHSIENRVHLNFAMLQPYHRCMDLPLHANSERCRKQI